MVKRFLLLVLTVILLAFPNLVYGYPSPGIRRPSENLVRDLILADEILLGKKRGMGWGACGVFKWRCGRQRVMTKKYEISNSS